MGVEDKKQGNVGEKKHPGQPTKYKPEYCELAYKCCLLKATDEDLAQFLDVNKSTITNWKTQYPEFLASIKAGKDIADAEVAKKLHERACGYSHKEMKVFCHEGVITEHEVTKHYPPDTAAAFIWLKNRAQWKDKQHTEHGIDENLKTVLERINGNTKGVLPSGDTKDSSRTP